MQVIERDCYLMPDPENEGFFLATIMSGEYGDIECRSRDPVRAEGMAWEELGRRLIQRTRTIAYKALHEGPNGYVP